MDQLNNVISWIATNVKDLWALWASLIAIASLIVKMTPTLKDDNRLKSFIKFVGKYIALDKYSPPTS